MNKHFVFLIFFSFFILTAGRCFCQSASSVHGQKAKMDSLESSLLKAKEDTNKVLILLELTKQYWMTDVSKSIQYGNAAYSLSLKLNYYYGKYRSYTLLAVIYYYQSNYSKAKEYYELALATARKKKDKEGMMIIYKNIGEMTFIQGYQKEGMENYEKSLQLAIETGDKKNISDAHISIGKIYYEQGNYIKALQNFLVSQKMYESINDSTGLLNTYSHLANIYEVQKNYTAAIHNLNMALHLAEKKGDLYSTGNAYNNIANIYVEQKKYTEAMKNYQHVLKIWQKIGTPAEMATIYGNMGTVYDELNNYSESQNCFFKALKLYREAGNKRGRAGVLLNIAASYVSQKKYKEAILYLKEAETTALQINYKALMKACYYHLSEVYAETHAYEKAYRYYKLYEQIKDTLLNAENSKNIARLQTIYETEKKDKEIQLLNKDKEMQTTVLKKQKIINYSVSAGLLLVVILSFFLYRSYLQKRKANLALTHAYIQIEEKNKIVEEKNKDITDSITYAKRIQQAILTPATEFRKLFDDSFIVYGPRDIVSGDFYWFSKLPNGEIMVAAVDCTGHGVPGAFMSVIGNDLLNKIITEQEITEPAEVLKKMNEEVVGILKQSAEQTGNHDGMDVALCKIDIQERSICFSGAMRPLYHIQKAKKEVKTEIKEECSGEYFLNEIKGDKFSVGGIKHNNILHFTTQRIKLEKGDSIYIFSDGYSDQFGGTEGKKYTSKRLKKALMEMQDKPMKEQADLLIQQFNLWKGSMEQVDDVLMLGIRV